MELEILKKIGGNKTKEKTFTNNFEISYDGETTFANTFYTYQDELFIITGTMEDVPFDLLDEKSQEKVFSEIMNDNYN